MNFDGFHATFCLGGVRDPVHLGLAKQTTPLVVFFNDLQVFLWDAEGKFLDKLEIWCIYNMAAWCKVGPKLTSYKLGEINPLVDVK